MADAQPLSPAWWLDRLYKQLADRQPAIDRFQRYYDGDTRLLDSLHDKARDAFQRLLRRARANVLGLVIDATGERIQVDGFRLGDSEGGDAQAWRIWQANNLDADSDLVFREALKTGRAFLLVAPNPDDPKTPLITPEHPSQAIVAYEPGNLRRRAAALKVWCDDWTDQLMATLYLPDELYKYKAPKPKVAGTGQAPRWERRQVDGESWPAPNPLGVVPMIEVRNRPDLLGGACSEIADLLDDQDRINKTLLDRMMAAEYSAFRQRWATGYDVPVDENNQPVEPFKAAVDRLWIAESPETKFGEFTATDLGPYLRAIEADVKHIASRARVPSQYMLGEMINTSGEALKAAESGLVSKVRQRMRPFGEALEEMIRLALTAAGDARGTDPATETIWRNPEYRTEGELVDALVKMASLGVPHEALWERWGASQAEIARWREMRADTASQIAAGPFGDLFAAPKQPAGGPVDQIPPEPAPPGG